VSSGAAANGITDILSFPGGQGWRLLSVWLPKCFCARQAWNRRSEDCSGLLLRASGHAALASEELSALFDISSEASASGVGEREQKRCG
jgi:hypothetical protein